MPQLISALIDTSLCLLSSNLFDDLSGITDAGPKQFARGHFCVVIHLSRLLQASLFGSALACAVHSGALDVVKQGHESKIHVELLVTVEQRHARIVGGEVDGGFLVSAQHHHVFHNSGRGSPCNIGKFEAVPV